MQVQLEATHGPHRGRTFSFRVHDTFIVGRGKDAHCRLPKLDGYFSRTHFMLEINPPHCLLYDMASTNGTYVNGERVEQAFLGDGDVIHGGNTAIRVSIGPSEADDEPPAVPNPLAPEALEAAVPREPPPGAGAGASPGNSAEQPAPLPAVPPTCPRVPETPAALAEMPPEYADKAGRQPQPLAGYKIIEEIGRGGMGVVYLAWREATGSLVALKTIRPAVAGSEANCRRFLREADILRQVRHPHIVAFEDMGQADGTMYFAMEYVPGQNVAELLRERGGRLPIGEAVRIASQVLEGLADAHSRGFVHRDVKPANLLVTVCDDRPLAKLTDFGLARMYHASQLSGLTMMGDTGGTVPYLAPEQITNYRDSKPPVDQYSAAATLYHLLTGRFIYDLPKEPSRKLLMVLQDDPVPIRRRRRDVPEELAAAIHRALARKPTDRFPHCMLFREALMPFLRR